jgi:hypothetical protein
MTETVTFNQPLVVGNRVSYSTHSDDHDSTGSGIFIGIAMNGKDGLYYYFIDGEINGSYQSCHGFPVSPDSLLEPTTDLAPTLLIKQARERRVSVESKPGWNKDGQATLEITRNVKVGNGLDYEAKQIAFFTLAYWPDSNEVVLTEMVKEDDSYSSEIVYSTEVS